MLFTLIIVLLISLSIFLYFFLRPKTATTIYIVDPNITGVLLRYNELDNIFIKNTTNINIGSFGFVFNWFGYCNGCNNFGYYDYEKQYESNAPIKFYDKRFNMRGTITFHYNKFISCIEEDEEAEYEVGYETFSSRNDCKTHKPITLQLDYGKFNDYYKKISEYVELNSYNKRLFIFNYNCQHDDYKLNYKKYHNIPKLRLPIFYTFPGIIQLIYGGNDKYKYITNIALKYKSIIYNISNIDCFYSARDYRVKTCFQLKTVMNIENLKLFYDFLDITRHTENTILILVAGDTDQIIREHPKILSYISTDPIKFSSGK